MVERNFEDSAVESKVDDSVIVDPPKMEEAEGSQFADYEDESPWANCEPRGEEEEEEEDGGHNKALGKRGEDAAARFLEARGFEILARNWKCDFGEVDIIAEDCESIHFIEVKTRSNVRKGFPAEAVSAHKRRKYEILAAMYLQNYERTGISVCFDIISILRTAENCALLRFHCNAFSGKVL